MKEGDSVRIHATCASTTFKFHILEVLRRPSLKVMRFHQAAKTSNIENCAANLGSSSSSGSSKNIDNSNLLGRNSCRPRSTCSIQSDLGSGSDFGSNDGSSESMFSATNGMTLYESATSLGVEGELSELGVNQFQNGQEEDQYGEWIFRPDSADLDHHMTNMDQEEVGGILPNMVMPPISSGALETDRNYSPNEDLAPQNFNGWTVYPELQPSIFFLERYEMSRLNNIDFNTAFCSAMQRLKQRTTSCDFRVIDLTQGFSPLGLQAVKLGASDVWINEDMPNNQLLLHCLTKANSIEDDTVQFGNKNLEENDGNWDVIITELVETCGALRQQVLEDIALARSVSRSLVFFSVKTAEFENFEFFFLRHKNQFEKIF